MKKRKRRSAKNKRSKRARKKQPIPDRRALEKSLADVGRLLETQEFDSLEDVEDYLNQILSSGEPLPTAEEESPLEQAQALMYEAWDAQGKERVTLAKQALKISADCADAYVLLAEETAKSIADAHRLYKKGVRAGERALGTSLFEEGEGHFWGIVKTRPYMRARAGLAQTSWYLGKRSEAIAHAQEMLRLNPGDNQGIRYSLANYLLAEKRDQEMASLLLGYEGDAAAGWAYSGALLAYRQEGATSKAEQNLLQAIATNRYVPDYLLGKRALPEQMPDHLGFGDENEAIEYAVTAMQVWDETDGALAWLEEVLGKNGDFSMPQPRPATSMSEVANDLLFMPDLDEDDFWQFDTGDFPPFELDRFLAVLEIPKKEHASIRRSLSTGLGKYFHDIYGTFKYGKYPNHLIDGRMHQPYIFGYGAVEILGHERISQTSKLKTCYYLVEKVDADHENGVPYGLITVLGYLAANKSLPMDILLKGTLALEYGNAGLFRRPDWMEGATKQSLIALADWIADHQEMDSEEKDWWAWKLSIQCGHQAHLGRAFAKHWLDKNEISDDAKLALSRAWASDHKQFANPPLGWQLMAAQQMGDLDQMKQLLRDAGIDPEQTPLPTPEEMPPLIDQEEDPLIWMMHNPQVYFLIPKYLKRMAIPAMVRFGEDLGEVADRFWDTDDYDEDALCNGVADAIQEFHHQLTPNELRRLVKRGLQHSKAPVRKRYYDLSVQFYGDELLRHALQDAAKSVRTWAGKKLKQGQGP
jgi:tetratricopeptide (TPR) repeat protein